MTTRNYSNTSVPTSLSDDINNSVTTIPVVSTAGFPSPPFIVAVNQGTVNEELMLVEAMDANNFTDVVRGYDDSDAVAASLGDDVLHVVAAIDYREFAEHQASQASDHLPPGIGPLPWAGEDDDLPVGWLLCDGSEVSRTTYAALFAVIGETYGEGNGSTTFDLPDMRGRVPVGLDNMGGASANRVVDTNADTLGGVGGTETITLVTAQMPVHTHIQASHTHAAAPHSHSVRTIDTGSIFDWWIFWGGGSGTVVPTNDGTGYFSPAPTIITRSDVAMSATVSITSATATNANAGSGEAHANMQPSIFLNYIIKY